MLPLPAPPLHLHLPILALQEYTAQLASRSSSGNEYEAAAAQVGVEVYSAMLAAIGG